MAVLAVPAAVMSLIPEPLTPKLVERTPNSCNRENGRLLSSQAHSELLWLCFLSHYGHKISEERRESRREKKPQGTL